VPGVISALRAANAIGAVSRVSAVSDALADTVKPRRLNAWLFGAFAIGALVIVGVGILGLTAMTTAERTREIGIRFALGATRDRVIGLLLREQLAAVLTGLAAGAVISIWASKFIRAYLYGVTASDPRVWTIAILAIVAVAIGGTLIPSLRASRANPVHALRAD
jgi:ABC-type antimicrobial peptide transport system permease subunit